jgi:hypothetical protein
MVNRNAADIVEAVVLHSLWHADAMIVADHHSDDGSREIVASLPVKLLDIPEPGFDGPKIKTWLAAQAFADGHEWAFIVDNDEVWCISGNPKLRIADFLASAPVKTMAFSAFAYDHIPTASDEQTVVNPAERIQWRQLDQSARKVAFRVRDNFRSDEHNAWYGDQRVSAPNALMIHHFTIRSADQLVEKIHTGLATFGVEAGMPPGFDHGWNQWKGMSDDEIRSSFYRRFWSDDPVSDETLVSDPAPLRRAS